MKHGELIRSFSFSVVMMHCIFLFPFLFINFSLCDMILILFCFLSWVPVPSVTILDVLIKLFLSFLNAPFVGRNEFWCFVIILTICSLAYSLFISVLSTWWNIPHFYPPVCIISLTDRAIALTKSFICSVHVS